MDLCNKLTIWVKIDETLSLTYRQIIHRITLVSTDCGDFAVVELDVFALRDLEMGVASAMFDGSLGNDCERLTPRVCDVGKSLFVFRSIKVHLQNHLTGSPLAGPFS